MLLNDVSIHHMLSNMLLQLLHMNSTVEFVITLSPDLLVLEMETEKYIRVFALRISDSCS